MIRFPQRGMRSQLRKHPKGAGELPQITSEPMSKSTASSRASQFGLANKGHITWFFQISKQIYAS